MRQAGIEGRHQRRRRCLTKQDKTAPPAPDLLGRDFAAHAPDIKWCGDITYIPTGESGFMYLEVTWNHVEGWIFRGVVLAREAVEASDLWAPFPEVGRGPDVA